MKKNALYIQSGGPTAVINSTAYGVITACMKNSDKIGRLYCAEHSIVGLLNKRLIDVYEENNDQLELLKQTPSAIFGSSRYRIPDANIDDSDYRKILDTLKQYEIAYIFYNGGNGTLRACRDMINYLNQQNYDCNIIAIPKTVDNDISNIDHSPGFPSAARHVAITVSELAHDIRVYDTGLIMVLEVMGRNTGWLAASTLLCAKDGNGPDLIFTPESNFQSDKFIHDVKSVYDKKGKCLAVVAEGVKDSKGNYLFEYGNKTLDEPYLNMGGITPYLTRLLKQHFSCKIRGLDLGLMQRCSIHNVSKVDSIEATMLGHSAVKAALKGFSEKMVTLHRTSSKPYLIEESLIDIEKASESDSKLPTKYITKDKNFIEESFLDYIEPLVGKLPKYSKLQMNLM